MATSITFTGGGARGSVSIGGDVRTDDALLDLGKASQDAGLTYRDTSGATHFVGVTSDGALRHLRGVTVSDNDVSGGTPGDADFARVDADVLVVSDTILTKNLIVDGEIADPSGTPVMTLYGGTASFAAIADSAGRTGTKGEVLTLDGSENLVWGSAASGADTGNLSIQTVSLGPFTNITEISTTDQYIKFTSALQMDQLKIHTDTVGKYPSASSENAKDIRLQVGNNSQAGSFAVAGSPHGNDGTEGFRVFYSGGSGYFQSKIIANYTTSNASNVYIDGAGYVGVASSSARYKTDIETLADEYADKVFEMRPVWFRSNTDTTVDRGDWSHYGFIAEEMAEVDPRLVHFNEAGEPEGVQYSRIIPHLVNVVQRQQATIASLEERLSALEFGP